MKGLWAQPTPILRRIRGGTAAAGSLARRRDGLHVNTRLPVSCAAGVNRPTDWRALLNYGSSSACQKQYWCTARARAPRSCSPHRRPIHLNNSAFKKTVERVRTTSAQPKDTNCHIPGVLRVSRMSQSIAPEDLALSTSQANEAAPSFSRTGGTRVAHPIPHLVGAPKSYVKADAVVDSAGSIVAHGLSTSQHGENHVDSQWTHRATTARPSRGVLHEGMKRTIDILGCAADCGQRFLR